MYGSMEESTPAAEAPALGPAELKAVRKLLSATSKTTTGDDDRPAGLLHEPQELSTSTLAKLEAASDEVELQASVWDASLFLFNPVAGRSASLFAFFLLVVNVFMQGSFAFYLINGLKCIKNFSADEWRGCTNDEKFDCGCTDDDGINYCCGSANQTKAIEIWSQCLAGE